MAQPFLCDFHVHSTFSDGKLTLSQLVDLYGAQGFGAIAITDHVPEQETWIGKASEVLQRVLTPATYPLYLSILEHERQRAWDQYRMVVLPGMELSQNYLSNRRSGHILALAVSEFRYADGDPLELIQWIHAQGGLAIAAHPVFSRKLEKQTYLLWDRREELREHFDGWEVASGPFLFPEVAEAKLPLLATSDLHAARQMTSWKTVLTCERNAEAICESIRKQELDFTFYRSRLPGPAELPTTLREMGFLESLLPGPQVCVPAL